MLCFFWYLYPIYQGFLFFFFLVLDERGYHYTHAARDVVPIPSWYELASNSNIYIGFIHETSIFLSTVART